MPYRQYGQIGQIEIAPGEGVSGKAFSSGEPVVVDDYDSWEGRSSQYPAGLIARSMGVPLKLGKEVTGVLAVERTAGKPPFNEQEVRLLSLFANQAALAISNAQLYHEAEQRSREVSHLYDTSLDITALLELDQVLEAVLQRTTDLVEAQMGEVVVYDEQKGIITDFLNLGLGEISMPLDVHRPGDSPSGLGALVIREREPVRVTDYDRWPERIADAPIGLVGPMIGIPILHQERILGSLSLARSAGSAPFSDEDQQRLVLFANQAAVAIQNARQVEELERLHQERLATERLNAQLETAKAVQSGLLPAEPPEIAGWELTVRWRPALQIGGDFYDFIDLGDGRWGIVVGDVADKGIPAAIFMSVALSLMRTHAADNTDPSRVLEIVNRKLVSGSHSGIFVTAVYGVLDPANSTITLASAGHNPILVRKAADGSVESSNPAGMVLGVESEPGLKQAQVSLNPGDLAILYTDGITEAMDPDNHQFGSERLEAFLESDLPNSAGQVAEALDHAIAEHVADSEQSDDITYIVIRALG
jgi:serine phosphatase RsbU (regulator of sigma subunit)